MKGVRVPHHGWIDATSGETRPDAIDLLARAPVVLLGEQHDQAAHHRWQLDTITALHGVRGDLILGFEMFPRRVQPVLDRWSRGELAEDAFLAASGWQRVWGFDPALYMPLFAFARRHALPMLALNIDRATHRLVAERGVAAVSRAEREGVGEAAPATAGYSARLAEVFRMHPAAGDPDRFERFVRAQQFWDRAMAEAIASARSADAAPLVVGIMGRGHVEFGDGVPFQLAALGIEGVATALPWPAETECPAGIADLVFGIAPAD